MFHSFNKQFPNLQNNQLIMLNMFFFIQSSNQATKHCSQQQKPKRIYKPPHYFISMISFAKIIMFHLIFSKSPNVNNLLFYRLRLIMVFFSNLYTTQVMEKLSCKLICLEIGECLKILQYEIPSLLRTETVFQ